MLLFPNFVNWAEAELNCDSRSLWEYKSVQFLCLLAIRPESADDLFPNAFTGEKKNQKNKTTTQIFNREFKISMLQTVDLFQISNTV